MTINTLLGSTSVELRTTVVRYMYILYKVIYRINSILNTRNECSGNNMNRQVTRILIIKTVLDTPGEEHT